MLIAIDSLLAVAAEQYNKKNVLKVKLFWL